jgi:hypothetical protein
MILRDKLILMAVVQPFCCNKKMAPHCYYCTAGLGGWNDEEEVARGDERGGDWQGVRKGRIAAST